VCGIERLEGPYARYAGVEGELSGRERAVEEVGVVVKDGRRAQLPLLPVIASGGPPDASQNALQPVFWRISYQWRWHQALLLIAQAIPIGRHGSLVARRKDEYGGVR
jgi:hypothetical protein